MKEHDSTIGINKVLRQWNSTSWLSIYQLVEHCDYGEIKEEMIRDHLTVRIHNITLLEKLQLDLDNLKTNLLGLQLAVRYSTDLQIYSPNQ